MKGSKEMSEEGTKEERTDKKLGRRRDDLRRVKALKTRLLEEKTQEVFSLGLSIGVYVRRRIFE